MPELPEVETIVRDLNLRLVNKKITEIKASDKKVFKLSAGQAKKLIGRAIKSVRRRAKMIIMDLGGNFLIIHLKMTGQLVYLGKGALIAGGHPIVGQGRGLPNKFTRVIFKFNDGSKLFFNDVRRFGWVKLADQAEFSKFVQELGVEPLSTEFTLEYFKKVLSRRPNTAIKQALMDQRHLAGMGNIYADESLFMAGIKPFRRVRTLQVKEIKKLWQAIPCVLRLAIKHRGTSFNDYVDAQGQTGNFLKYLRVYGRAGEKCKVCASLIKKTKLGGRGTHWCDYCQK